MIDYPLLIFCGTFTWKSKEISNESHSRRCVGGTLARGVWSWLKNQEHSELGQANPAHET